MVRSLTLQRFRSHLAGRLEFCPGVNGIIGISQSGKTNIIRALIWLTTLRPTSKSVVHLREPKTDAKVELETYDGHNISLEKGLKTSGTYTCDGITYRKFGRSVPEPVLQALNLSDINFHGQFDSPFLVMSKPSEISRTINDLTGMSAFDEWINKVNEGIRDRRAEQKLLETAHEMNLIELEAMERLEDCEPHLKKAAEIKRERVKLEEQFDLLDESHRMIQKFEAKIAEAEKVLELKPALKRLERVRKRLDKAYEKHDAIEKVLNQDHLIDMANEERRDLIDRYAQLLKQARKCPTCLSPIRQSTIKRLINEISANVRFTRNGENPGWKVG